MFSCYAEREQKALSNRQREKLVQITDSSEIEKIVEKILSKLKPGKSIY